MQHSKHGIISQTKIDQECQGGNTQTFNSLKQETDEQKDSK